MNGTPEQGIPLLTTKLHVPPFRARGVRRPRLIHRLEEGLRLRHRLTLLSAPPGYGKTTLLSEWLQGGDGSRRLASPVAWVSLDEGDNDPMRFWQYVLAALQTVNPAVGQAVPPMLSQAPARPAETVAAALLNDIATASSDLILVLDDYHVIRAGAVHRSLDFLLDHLPASDPSLHVAISTRADPPLSLARRRGRAEITELRARELRFTPEEAAGFLNDAMGLGLSEDQVAALADRTEGWAVGLQLAALALQHSPTGRDDLVSTFAGDDRHVGDYLVEEVLQRQPRALRRFMLRTSILESLSGPLCDAVTGGTDGQRILTELEQANLFLVPLDNRRLWYRYHQLFADLLHRRLRREAATRELAALHQRAAAWYEQEGRIEAAVRHWLSAEEYPHAACLIEQHVADMQARGRGTTVLSWLEGLPEPLIHGHPRLCLAQAWALHGIGHVDAAEPYLQSVEQLLGAAGREPSLGDAESAEADRMLGEAAVIRGLIPLLQGDLDAAVRETQRALQRLPLEEKRLRGTATFNLADAWTLQGDVRSAGQAYAQAIELSRGTNDLMAAIGLMRVAELHLLGGRLRRAANTYDQMQRLFPEPVPVYISGLVDYGWGELLREWNKLDDAEQRLRQALDRGKQVVEPRLLLSGYVALARVLQAQGAGPAALRTIREALQVELDYGVTWTWGLPSPGAFEARLWLAQGNLDAAGRWADERPWSDEGAIPYRREVEILIVARVYLAQGRTAAAITLLDRLQVAAQENERTGRVLEILTLQALALQAQGHPARALKVLAEALALAEPEGYVRLFLDEGPPMARLLYQALENQIQPDYCGRLLQAVDLLSTADPRQRGDEPSLVESLSEREREVLALVAEGLTNREIAQRLVIAPGTVKVHTANIYGKLGVHSRIQAVAKARELGILPRR